MKRFILLALFSASWGHCATAGISVQIVDNAAIPGGVLAAAKKEASFVLRSGGINVTWRECPKRSECYAPVTPNELIILIRPSNPDKLKARVRGEVMGNAVGPRDGSGIYAWVWYDEVRRASARGGFTTWHDLLGCVIAHEIGHLLLGPDHHPGTVMQGNWGSRELALISKRRLRFDTSERAQMEMCVDRRVRSSNTLLSQAAIQSFRQQLMQQGPPGTDGR